MISDASLPCMYPFAREDSFDSFVAKVRLSRLLMLFLFAPLNHAPFHTYFFLSAQGMKMSSSPLLPLIPPFIFSCLQNLALSSILLPLAVAFLPSFLFCIPLRLLASPVLFLIRASSLSPQRLTDGRTERKARQRENRKEKREKKRNEGTTKGMQAEESISVSLFGSPPLSQHHRQRHHQGSLPFLPYPPFLPCLPYHPCRRQVRPRGR